MTFQPQTTFSRGAIGPELHQAQHLTAYNSSLAECENAVVLKRGGLRRRGGTKMIGEVKNSADGAVLIPFQFSTAQTYMLEMGDYYFRVYQSGGRVGSVEVVTPYSIEEAGDVVFTQHRDTLFLSHRSHKPRKILRTSDINWAIDALVITDGPYLEQNFSGTALTPGATGGAVPRLTSDASSFEGVAARDVGSNVGNAWNLFDQNRSTTLKGTKISDGNVSFTYTSSFYYKVVDAYFVVGGGRPLRSPISWTLDGFDGTSWIILDSQEAITDWVGADAKFFEFTNTVAYQAYRFRYYDIAADSEQFQLAEIGLHEAAKFQTPITLTASAVTGINGDQGFLASDVGRPIKFVADDGVSRFMEIVTRVSSTVVTVRIHGHSLPSLTPSTRWSLGAWSDETGWPAHTSFYKERLAFAATDTEPTGVWMSVSQDFTSFTQSTPLLTSDALSLEILSKEVNGIQWLVEDEELICGTSQAVRRIGKTANSEAFGPENVEQKRTTSIGANSVQPVSVGSTVLYLGRFGKKLLELVYSFDVNGYISQDVSAFSNHLLKEGIAGATYQEYPDSILWMYDTAGDMVGFTYEREQKIFGFHRHTFGGKVEAVSSISAGDQDEVWLIVKRVINGETKRFLEVMQDPFDGDDRQDAWHLDCASLYDGAPAHTISGLDYLEGEEVGTHGDGASLGTATVSGGSISLPNDLTASKILIGLPFTTRVKLLKPPRQVRDGSGLGRHMRPDNVLISVYETGSLLVGSDTSGPDGSAQLDELIQFEDGDDFGVVPLKTKTYNANPPIRWSDDGQLVFEVHNTQTATLLAVNLNLEGEP
ncbi:MAG: hypothetical protein JKY34_09265 [Kordiimonadaceae bacterium]|nr:hypothetical protein [Kordiimonadaceae bacterium]